MNGLFLTKCILGAAAVAGIFYAGVRGIEQWELYHPSRVYRGTPADAGLPFEDARLALPGGTQAHAWWIPCASARGTVIFFHGNAENIGDLAELAAAWHRRRMNVLLAEYPGYGQSEGRPGESGLYAGARAAFDVAIARAASTNLPVIAHGRSLGAAVAARLAVDRPVRGVILESAFASTEHMARVMFPGIPMGRLLHQRFDTLSCVAKLHVPVLMAHSPDDEMVPFAQAEEIFKAAREPKRFVRLAGGHNSGFTPAHLKFEEEIGRFTDEICGP